MKHTYLLMISLFLSLVLSGCKKDQDLNTADQSMQPKLVWQHPLDTLDYMGFAFTESVRYEGHPVFGLYTHDCQFGAAQMITCLDADTGAKRWGFDLDDPCAYIWNPIYEYEGVLVVNTSTSLQAYDLPSGTIRWEIPFAGQPYNNGSGSFGIGQHLYLEVFTGYRFDAESSALWEINVHNGKYRILMEVQAEPGNGYPRFNPPALWINPVDGDSILYFTLSYFGTAQGQWDPTGSCAAYSLTDGKLLWHQQTLGIPSHNDKRPILMDNKVYLFMDWQVICFDALTGEKLWVHHIETASPYPLYISDWHIMATKGKILINPISRELRCLDALTGQLLWEIPAQFASPIVDPVEHNGVLYFLSYHSNQLVGVELESGEVLFKTYNPTKKPFKGGCNILLDPVRKLITFQDQETAYAYELVR